MSTTLIVPPETALRLERYSHELQTGQVHPGALLAATLGSVNRSAINADAVLRAILDTKRPCIFAESAVNGDGTDWNLRELSLLGDISVAMDVIVYDDGRHHAPSVHVEPFPGTLIFTPGALLRNDTGGPAADWNEVTTEGGKLDPLAYRALYARRLVPVFAEIQRRAHLQQRRAVVTVPGLGCGQFAGPFSGQLGFALRDALAELLQNHARAWRAIALVYFDPYNECEPSSERVHHLEFRVRPFTRMPIGGLPQLCHPTAYQEGRDDFSNCDLYSLVAWDHVSWPGNDFNGGARSTDDGVKAAATSALHSLTGIAGNYDPKANAYRPPAPYRIWSEVLSQRAFPSMPVV